MAYVFLHMKFPLRVILQGLPLLSLMVAAVQSAYAQGVELDQRHQFCFVVREDRDEFALILDQALTTVPKTERDSARPKWSPVCVEHAYDYRVLFSLGLAILLAIAFIVRLRRIVRVRTTDLQREIAVRHDKEKELEASNAQVRALNLDLEDRVEARTHQLRQANDELRLAMDQLVQTEKVASLGRLVAGVAHELNTPLGNTLITASTLTELVKKFAVLHETGALRRSNLDMFLSQCLSASALIERNSERAARLISDFKEITVDQTSDHRRKFKVGDIVDAVIAANRSQWKNRELNLDVAVPPDIEMDSYPRSLYQVLFNLLQNTLLHGIDGIREGKILISAKANSTHLHLHFSDNGKGISSGDLKKIFDPFFTTSMGQGGSGLGLSVVHNQITRVLGGSITVTSTFGQGTHFEMTVPLVASHHDAMPVLSLAPGNVVSDGRFSVAAWDASKPLYGE